MAFQSLPGNLEPTLREIKEIRAELNNTTAELQNAQNALDPKLAEIRALKNELKKGNGGKSTKDVLNMASSKIGNGGSPKTLAATGISSAVVGSAPEARQAASPATNGDSSRPTLNLTHVGSRDCTNDGFGGCSVVRDRYGEDVDKDRYKQKPMSEMERSGLGNVSTSNLGTNALMGTIDLQNGVGNGSSTGHLHVRDIASFNSSGEATTAKSNGDAAVATNVKEVPNLREQENPSPAKSVADVDNNKPISYMTPIVPVPHAHLTPVQPKDTTVTYKTTESAKPKITPRDLQPGDQVIERVKRIHQGGLAPGPNGQPVSARGKTLLTIVSAQGTKFAFSDKNLASGQQIIETVETVHEGFALPDPPHAPKRRWSWLAPLGSPGMDGSVSKASVVASQKVGTGTPAASPSRCKTVSGPVEVGDNVTERPGQTKRKSSFLDNLIGRNSGKEAVKGKEKQKESVEGGTSSEPQQPQTQKEQQYDPNWFDKILDGLAGRIKEKTQPTVQN